MARELDQDELIDRWTLAEDELALVAGKRGATRLGFAVLLRFYTEQGRFPRGRGEIPDVAVDYVARQVGVPASEVAFYDWSGRTIKAPRVQTAERWDSGSAASPTPTSSRSGWSRTSPRPSAAPNADARSYWRGAVPNASSRPRAAVLTASSARPCTAPRSCWSRGCPPAYPRRCVPACSPWSPPPLTTARVRVRMARVDRRCWLRSGPIRAMSA